MWWFYRLAMHLSGAWPVRLVAPVEGLDPAAFDGLIIGGGDHISAEIYKGKTKLDVRIDPARDAMELDLLRHGIASGTPVLGVCRGAQMLNVYYGGSLHQDLRAVFTEHPALWTPLPRKRVRLAPDSRIAGLMGVADIRVNSLHRQAIDKVGTGLQVTGWDEYGTIQAIEDPSALFRIGVQWHPEFLIHHRAQRRLFGGFIAAVRAFMAARQ
jgi:putative glutamine amidotransferase